MSRVRECEVAALRARAEAAEARLVRMLTYLRHLDAQLHCVTMRHCMSRLLACPPHLRVQHCVHETAAASCTLCKECYHQR